MIRIQQQQPIAPPGHGVEKYGPAGLLASSADRGWSGLSAELRSHGDGVIEWKSTPTDLEICVDIRGNRSVVTRRGSSFLHRTVTERGTVWLSPPCRGMQGSTHVSDPLPGLMHIYLPSSHFSPDNLGIDVDNSVVGSLRYESGLQDPLLTEIAYAIEQEMQTQTSVGQLLAETLASVLAARVIQRHVSPSPAHAFLLKTRQGLDRRRMSRVLDYIEAHLEGDLALDRLAAVACLSRFHFARAFKAAMGQSPYRYVSAKRLERAKALLIRGDQSLADVALTLQFSCQANFTRAFREVTGQTPGQYRRNFSM